MYMNGWQMGGQMAGMWVFWIVAIVLIALAAVFLAKALQGPRDERNSSESILKQRYARGDISKQEYDRMLADIRH